MSYDLLKTIHAVAAYAWLGSLFGSLLYATVVTRRDPAGIFRGALGIVRFSTRVGLPAAVILLVCGIWMVADGGASGGSAWITAGFLLWIVAAVVGSGLMHPAFRKMRNASEAEAVLYAKRIVWIGGAEIIAIAAAIWVMGAKPGG